MMFKWWKQRKMRWAVREHRRIHGSGSQFLMSPCKTYRLLRSTLLIIHDRMPVGEGDTIRFKTLDRI